MKGRKEIRRKKIKTKRRLEPHLNSQEHRSDGWYKEVREAEVMGRGGKRREREGRGEKGREEEGRGGKGGEGK